ncbi:MAG TPA: hypothetical protein VHJ18_13030 [Streptosporangiaceae bacterium]|nr:hypothetical protein [Streptosporangiaceae bacterium]
MLRFQDFRRFYVGYATSLLGSAMATVGVTFAVLGSGGSAADLGFVFAAGVIPQVVFMLGGGYSADLADRGSVRSARHRRGVLYPGAWRADSRDHAGRQAG